MPPPYTISSSQRPSFELADRILQTETASNSHAAQSLSRLRVSSEGWGQNNGPEKPLDESKIWITVLACIIGTAILFCILYYCWRHCGPRPTYYEAAVRAEKKSPTCQCTRSRRYPLRAPRRISSTRWVDPLVAEVDDEVARPDIAKTRSSSWYCEQ
ncbi:hypothetical protein F5Y01DRAFT_169035 [Xylaria sp. FL0043]|nr:hypothetical protein F5Y01DRAFT_169035 [Xylaria sp. FL0043]